MYTADQICNMIDFIVNNIFAFEVSILSSPMGTNCAPLLADLFLYSYESECLDSLVRSSNRKLASSFILC